MGIIYYCYAPVAQRIEQDGSNVKVGGSIPSWGTKTRAGLLTGFCFGSSRSEFGHPPKKVGVKIAYGNLQENLHLQTGLQSRSSGPAECRSIPSWGTNLRSGIGAAF